MIIIRIQRKKKNTKSEGKKWYVKFRLRPEMA